jgi:hypothetical protein
VRLAEGLDEGVKDGEEHRDAFHQIIEEPDHRAGDGAITRRSKLA